MTRRPSNSSRPPLFPWWLVFIAVALAGLIVAGVWAVLTESRPPRNAMPTSNPIVTVLAAPTPSPLAASATPALSPTPPTPTPEAVPTSSGEVQVGDLVQVVGTGVNGLNLRVAPGLNQAVNLFVFDSEVFRVEEGPREVDGFTWWLLADLQDPARGGWAVQNYLEVVQGN